MDFSEATKIVFSRIKTIEPELVSKIIGYLLLKDCGDREMIRLAFGPDSAIHSLVGEAKAALPGLALNSRAPAPAPMPAALHFPPFSPAHLSTRTALSLSWDRPQALPGYPEGVNDEYLQAHFLGGVDDSNPAGFYPHEPPRSARRSPGLPELPAKVCHYYFKGYCKHGSNCRFSHGQNGMTFADMGNEEGGLSPGSLEQLEHELTELLRSRGGQPVSIAILPMLYFERYGKVLQADGYLTESQRHGKAGFSLTKLLARLKNSIRILDSRPHGQHSVVLVEDAGRHSEFVAGSQQIYLTFPAESEFSEEDVSNYFKQFGAVRDVRIPCQQKRMFGFVTFEKQETAQFILSQGNPHFVCGARVLVKPYKEKSRVQDRKYMEKIEHPAFNDAAQYLEMDPELYSIPRFFNNARSLKKQLLEEHEQMLELQNLRLSELRLVGPKLLAQPHFGGYGVKDAKIPEEIPGDFAAAGRLYPQRDLIMNDGPTNEGGYRNPAGGNSRGDEDSSLGLSLPDSPFASASVVNGISAAI